MNFNSFRKEITSKNASVKELVNDIFLNIESKDSIINSNQKFDTIIHCAFSESKTKEVDYYNQYKSLLLDFANV